MASWALRPAGVGGAQRSLSGGGILKSVAILGFTAAAFAVSGAARASCVFEEPGELRDALVLRLPFEPIPSSPPGGTWWSFAPVDDFGTRCDDVHLETREGSAVPVSVVHDGPAAIAFRVPLDLAPETAVEYSVRCSDGGSATFGTLTVADGDAPPSAAPVFQVSGSQVFEWRFPACPDEGQLFMQDQILTTTFVDLALPGDTRQYLLDAWLVPPGGDLPSERAARAADALLLPVGEPAVRLRIDDEGAFDAHLRLTDALSGAVSDIVVTAVDTPGPRFAGCSSGHPGEPALLTALGIAIRAGSRRRARQRTEHTR